MVERSVGSPTPEGVPESDHAPATSTGRSQDAAPAGVALRRLLAVTTLTPAQARLLAADLAEELIDHDRNGRSPARVGDRTVTVTDGGRLTVPAAEAEAADDDPVSSAAALVRRIAEGTRRHPQATVLADAVTEPVAGVDDLARRIRSAAADAAEGEDDTGRARKELAALVIATQGRRNTRQEPSGQDDERPAAVTPLTLRPLSPRMRRRRLKPRRRGKTWKSRQRRQTRKYLLIGLVVLLVGALGWWGAPKAWTEVQRGWKAVFDTREPPRDFSPVTPTTDAEPAGTGPSGAGDSGDGDKKDKKDKEPVKVTLPAPKKAGAVTGVTIHRAEGPCGGETSCPVRVDVRLKPSSTSQAVDWTLRIFDRCSGKKYSRKGLAMTAEPGWRQVYGITRPSLPRTEALAIVAVTKAPARASSEPLYVPARDAKC